MLRPQTCVKYKQKDDNYFLILVSCFIVGFRVYHVQRCQFSRGRGETSRKSQEYIAELNDNERYEEFAVSKKFSGPAILQSEVRNTLSTASVSISSTLCLSLSLPLSLLSLYISFYLLPFFFLFFFFWLISLVHRYCFSMYL